MLHHSPFACSSNGFGKPKPSQTLSGAAGTEDTKDWELPGIAWAPDPCSSGVTASLSLFYPPPKSI